MPPWSRSRAVHAVRRDAHRGAHERPHAADAVSSPDGNSHAQRRSPCARRRGVAGKDHDRQLLCAVVSEQRHDVVVDVRVGAQHEAPGCRRHTIEKRHDQTEPAGHRIRHVPPSSRDIIRRDARSPARVRIRTQCLMPVGVRAPVSDLSAEPASAPGAAARDSGRTAPGSFSLLFCAYNESAIVAASWRPCASSGCVAGPGDPCVRRQLDRRHLRGALGGTGPASRGAGAGRTGKAHGMKVLAAQAKGDLLVFTDANVMLEPDALAGLCRTYVGPHGRRVLCGTLLYTVSSRGHHDGDESAVCTGDWRRSSRTSSRAPGT